MTNSNTSPSQRVREYVKNNRKSLSATDHSVLVEAIRILEWIEDQPPDVRLADIKVDLAAVSVRLLTFLMKVMDGPFSGLWK